MSRIGKLPIKIKEGVRVEIDQQKVKVFGPKGELELELPQALNIEQAEGKLRLKPRQKSKQAGALWGLWRSLLQNAVQGAAHGFEKKLELVGIGYKAVLKDNSLQLQVGYSHLVAYQPPTDITAQVEKNIITLTGIDKQKVGQTAAEIRAIRKPEPYKGKGIRYLGEVVQLKPGKAAKATTQS